MYQVGDKIQFDNYYYLIHAEVISVDQQAQLVKCSIINSAEAGMTEYAIPFEALIDWKLTQKSEPLGGWLSAEPECCCDVKALLSFGHETTCAYMRSRK